MLRGWILVAFVLLNVASMAVAADPWSDLQAAFEKKQPIPPIVRQRKSAPAAGSREASLIDPWAQLQAIYLPFTEAEEETAQVDPVLRRKVAAAFHQSLAAYDDVIAAAATRFNIPAEIIAAVIMVESSGNTRAAAPGSSAKGLMQTIDATFAQARAALLAQGLHINNDPFDPRASIMAGSWYLDQMFRRVEQDRGPVLKRNSLASWRLPTEYYYAGPGHGRKRSPVVMIYAGGKKIRVDKAGYSSKVLRWARIMV